MMTEKEQWPYGVGVHATLQNIREFYAQAREIPHVRTTWVNHHSQLQVDEKKAKELLKQHSKWYACFLGVPEAAIRPTQFRLEDEIHADLSMLPVERVIDLMQRIPSTIMGNFSPPSGQEAHLFPMFMMIVSRSRKESPQKRSRYEIGIEVDQSNPNTISRNPYKPKNLQDLQAYQLARKKLVEIVHGLDVAQTNIENSEASVKERLKNEKEAWARIRRRKGGQSGLEYAL